VAYAVGLYITAAYWFTASTLFANPAVLADQQNVAARPAAARRQRRASLAGPSFAERSRLISARSEH
jgi:hypothetical protein